LEAINQSKKDEGKVSAGIVEALSEPSDGEGLARSPADQKVD
jgi:hypothetical protein